MGKEEEEEEEDDFVPMHAKEEGRPIGIHRSNQETQTAFVLLLDAKVLCVACFRKRRRSEFRYCSNCLAFAYQVSTRCNWKRRKEGEGRVLTKKSLMECQCI